jgi:hypothetical protein
VFLKTIINYKLNKMKRTEEEIQRQIDGLNAQKKWLPEFSSFGDDNWGQIAVQIEVLQGKTDLEDLIEDDDEDTENGLYDAAIQAEDWLDGRINDDLFEARD